MSETMQLRFYTLCCLVILQSIECKQNHLFERKIKDEKVIKKNNDSCYGDYNHH